MKFQEIRAIARKRGIDPGRMTKTELIRAIQRAEGNLDCFGRDVEEYCEEELCLWRDDCIFESGVEEVGT